MRDFFRRNMGYKTISLVLAIIFWLWIASQSESPGLFGRQTLDIPLVIYNQPSNLVLVSKVSSVKIVLDNNNNQSISVKDLFAYVDLKDAVAGEHSFEVFVERPQGINLEEINPKSVVLRLEPVKDKILPVVAVLSGTPSSGFTAGEPIITPPVVNIRGPVSILEKLERVYVDIDVSGVKDSLQVERGIIYRDIEGKGIFDPNPNLESLRAFPDTVDVVVPIIQRGTASKMLPLRVSTRGTPPAGMAVRAVTPLPAQVQVLGDEEVLQTLQYITLRAIDVSGINSNRVLNIALETIELPDGVSFSDGTKISVMVTVGEAVINKVLSNLPVAIRNVPQGLTADPIAPVSVTVSGYPERLNRLSAGDVTVWIDAAGMAEGTYPGTDLLWNVPAGVAMVQAPKVNLVLKPPPEPSPPPGETGTEGQQVGGADFSLPAQTINNNFVQP